MKVVTTAADDLTLVLVKKHLLVDHTSDDDIINQYMAASLEAVETTCHAHFLKRTWEGTIYESEILLDNTLSLHLPINPKAIGLTFATEEGYNFEPFEWYYCSQKVKVTLDNVDLVEAIATVTAVTGFDVIPAQINQARLLIIGSWYAQRENDVMGISVNDLPSGAIKFLLPMMQEVAL